MIDTTTGLAAQQDIREVAAMWGALEARLRPSSSSTGGGTRGKPGSRPPIDLAVSDLMAEVGAEARFYARCLADETDDYAPTDTSTRALLTDIADRYGHWVTDDEKTALDFCDTWHEMRRKVAGMVTSREPKRWLGPCVQPECHGDLYAGSGAFGALCPTCGAAATLADVREHLMEAFETRLMNRSELVSALFVMGYEVKIKTVERWCERFLAWEGRDMDDPREARRPCPQQSLEPVVRDPYLYRFAQAYDLATRPSGRMVA